MPDLSKPPSRLFDPGELFAFWNAPFARLAGETDAMFAPFYRVELPLLGADDGYRLLMVRLAEARDLCQDWHAPRSGR